MSCIAQYSAGFGFLRTWSNLHMKSIQISFRNHPSETLFGFEFIISSDLGCASKSCQSFQWRMVKSRLCETARLAFFSARQRHLRFLKCEIETLEPTNYETETFHLTPQATLSSCSLSITRDCETVLRKKSRLRDLTLLKKPRLQDLKSAKKNETARPLKFG